MSSKRDYSDLDDGEIPEPTPKRAKQQLSKSSKSSRQHQNSGIDPTWGQKYVFSNQDDATTIPYGEESDFEDDGDAMAYLQSVRHEAYGIPHLLVAPKVQIGPQLPAELQTNSEDDGDGAVDRSIYHDPIADARGWYEDGAYMARPDPEQQDDNEEPDALDHDGVTEKAVHEAYFTSLLDQYNHLRRIVRARPPPNATLPRGTPTFAAAYNNDSRTTRLWSGVLHKTDPHPLQIARLSKESVLRILRIILGGKFLRQGYTIDERTSRWLWALLARLPDRGELGYAEIGWVRDLGRRAVLLGRSLSEMAALREELEEGALGVHEGVDGSSSDDDMLADDNSHGPEAGDNTTASAPATAPTSEIGGDSRSQVTGEADDERDQTAAQTLETNNEIDEGNSTEGPKQKEVVDDDEQEEGEIEDDEDVAMELASNSSVEGAPVVELDEAKARLLENLLQDEHVDAAKAAKERSRVNMRATLNMILTVAGEFYGQRDLLEFREPFVGL